MEGILLALLALSLGEPPTGRLSVTLLAGGEGVRAERYCAVVAPGNPAPLREAVLGPDAPGWTLELKPGKYGLLCSAFGFSAKPPTPFELLPGETKEMRVELRKLVFLQGRVVLQGSGKPAVGALVELFTQRTGQFPLRSPLLADHLRRKHSAITDETGTFKLPVLPSSETSLAISGPGLAQWSLTGVKVGAEGGDLGEISVPPGGTIEVRLRGARPWGAKEVWLRPVLQEALSGEELTDEMRNRLEKLTSVRVHNDEVYTLSGLVPGEYRVFLWDAPPGTWTFPPGATPGPYWVSDELTVTPGGVAFYEFAVPEVEAIVELSGLNVREVSQISVSVSGPNYYIQSQPLASISQAPGNEEPKSFRFGRLLHHPGKYTFWVSQNGLPGSRYLGELQVAPGERGSHTLQASLSGTRLRLRILGSKGTAVKGAKVKIGENASPCARYSPYSCVAISNDEGWAECGFAPERELVFWVWHENEGWARFASLPKHDMLVNLKPGRRVEGWLLDENGQPLEGFDAFFAPRGENLLLQFHTPTDEAGHVALLNVPDVDGVVAFASSRATESARPVVLLGLEKGRSTLPSPVIVPEKSGGVQLQRGSAKGTGKKDAPPLLVLEKEELYLLPPVDVLLSHSAAQRGSSVEFWRRLPEGKYRLVAVDETCVTLFRSKPFVVRAGETTRLSGNLFSP